LQLGGPLVQARVREQPGEVAGLQRRVADRDLGRLRAQRGFDGRAHQRRMRDHRLHPARALVGVQHPVRLDDDACPGRDRRAERAPGVAPAEGGGGASERASDFAARRAAGFVAPTPRRVVAGGAHGRDSRVGE
jgi:hypothetical protein